jgi:hypothetical protein
MLEVYVCYGLSSTKHTGSGAGSVRRGDVFAIDIGPALVPVKCCREQDHNSDSRSLIDYQTSLFVVVLREILHISQTNRRQRS